MKDWREALSDYLSMRRGLGFKLTSDGRALSAFVSFLEQHKADYITTRLALEWCQQCKRSVQPITMVGRLGYVRAFARHLSASDPRNEVPSRDLLPFKRKRVRPYLYTDTEVQQLMAATVYLGPVGGLRHLTYYCFLGLIAVTGMRLSEPINLKDEDVDLDAGILTIHGAKFGKSRMVPLHATTKEALREYKDARDRLVKARSCSNFFVSTRYTPLIPRVVEKTFDFLSRKAGLRGEAQRKGPRIHDLRHTMAVKTLLRWYQDGDDAERRLPVLSTYLGHVHVGSTYWYLSNCPELMQEAVKRLERRGR
jgi:integrase/recombinase XerD